jgi:hypothetical protein
MRNSASGEPPGAEWVMNPYRLGGIILRLRTAWKTVDYARCDGPSRRVHGEHPRQPAVRDAKNGADKQRDRHDHDRIMPAKRDHRVECECP